MLGVGVTLFFLLAMLEVSTHAPWEQTKGPHERWPMPEDVHQLDVACKAGSDQRS
jgi:hypothetical protein